jgi:hypothetical protein
MEGSSQAAHLVVGMGVGDSVFAGFGGHLGHLASQGFYAAQGTTHHQPADEPHDGQQDGQSDLQ